MNHLHTNQNQLHIYVQRQLLWYTAFVLSALTLSFNGVSLGLVRVKRNALTSDLYPVPELQGTEV